jgi:hypothetical protein
LLAHNASVDFNGGEALEIAAKLNAVSLLRAMLQGRAVLGSSLSKAFESADQRRYEVVELFLDAGLKGEPLHTALVVQSKRGDKALDVCSLLLKHCGESINEHDGEALNTAVSLGAIQLVRAMLLERKASSSTLSRAFESALDLADRVRLIMMQLIFDAGLPKGAQVDAGLLKLVQRGSKDTESIQALLKFGASVHYDDHEAIHAAARLCHLNVLELLLCYVTDKSAPSLVFGDRLRECRWQATEVVETLEILLQHGAQGNDIHVALVLSVSESNTNPIARKFVSVLLSYDVDVNYDQGRPLQIAAEIADLGILSIMMAKKPKLDSLVMAFPHIFKAKPRPREAILLSFIRLFRENAGEELSSSAVRPKITDPAVFMSIDVYPESTRILEAILDTGFPVDQKMYHDLPGLGNVSITPLYWALSGHGKAVPEPVVYLLLKRGGNVPPSSNLCFF